MVVGAFPVAKLAGLLLRQISKPIANIAKEKAKNHPKFRVYVCMPPAQFYHWCEVKMKMWIMNLGRPVEIPKLNEAMAIELGANLLGEAIIFSVAAVILLAEYVRQSKKEAAKEQARLDAMQQLRDSIRDLHSEMERRSGEIRQLSDLLRRLQKQETAHQGVTVQSQKQLQHHASIVLSKDTMNNNKGLVQQAVEICLTRY